MDAGLAKLSQEHWQEVGRHKKARPLDVDWKKYAALERVGATRWLSARDQSDNLVGYNSFLIGPSLNYRKFSQAMNIGIYLTPSARKGRNGIAMIDAAETELAKLNVTLVLYHGKLDILFGHGKARGTLGRLLQRLGYRAAETLYDKFLVKQV